MKDIFFPNFGQLYYTMKPKDICKQDPLDIFIYNFNDAVGIVEILNLDKLFPKWLKDKLNVGHTCHIS